MLSDASGGGAVAPAEAVEIAVGSGENSPEGTTTPGPINGQEL